MVSIVRLALTHETFGQAKDSYATLDEILNAKMKDEGVRSITKEVLNA